MTDLVADSVMLTLIFGAYTYVLITGRANAGRIDKKAEKHEVEGLRNDIKHISDRVDRIYEHFVLNGGMKRLKEREEKEGK